MRRRALVPTFALLLVCAACGASGSGGDGSVQGRPSTAATTAPGTTTPAGTDPSGAMVVPSGQGPVGLAVDSTGAVWVAEAGSSQVTRVRDGHPDLHVTGIDTPLRLAATPDGVWATAFGTGELVALTDAGAIRGRVAVGKGAEGVSAGFGSIWVVAQDAGRLVRVDPRRIAVQSRIDVGVGARLVTTGLGSVWVSHFQDGQVLRIDPRHGTVTRSDQLCQGPQGLLTSGGSLWITCTKDDVLLRLDPKTLRATARVAMPEAPDGIAAGPAGTIVVISQAGPTLVTIDATTATVRSRKVLGTQPQLFDQANLDVAVAPDGVWTSSYGENVLRRVGSAS